MKRILIIEDHELAARGTQEFLERDTLNQYAFHWEPSGEAALAELEEETFDLILLDLGLKGMQGFEVLRRLRKFDEYTPVIVLSEKREDMFARDVLQAKGQGYMEKSISPEEMQRGVRKVLNGQHYFSERLLEEIFSRIYQKHGSTETRPELSEQERDMIRYLCHGYEVKEIAIEEKKTKAAIHTRLQNLREKIGVRNNLQLMVWSVHMGLC